MEKILLQNQKELEIYSISTTGNQMQISFKNGDIVLLEKEFLEAEALEKIILMDEAGQAMSAFKNYAILTEIGKQKNIVIDEITDESADIVTVTLQKEPDWVVSQRQQDARIAAVEETADTLVMEALA
ncbi:hypothetical protein CE91St58_09830 [Lachnospiraceae bacterium]|uniref:hypothetical protein n=1 Tax=Eisenbergiella porci TaxID=2652274 RepID=UPI00208D9C9A|nr:hypothetical protein CE91St58_09830 [Lachnospiraceae bacterium]